MKKNIPNIITFLALTCGVAGVFFAFSRNFQAVLFFIVLAGIFDFLDGLVARILNARSELGVQLDSLSDMVSFGVLPSLSAIVFMGQLYSINSIPELLNENFGFVVVICLPVLIALMSALRLGKFNIDDKQYDSFIGLPTPANALFVLSYIVYFTNENLLSNNILMYVSPVVFLVSAYLLVARVKLFSLKIKSLSFKDNWYRYALIPALIVAYFIVGISAMVIVIPFYILLSVIIMSKQEENNG